MAMKLGDVVQKMNSVVMVEQDLKPWERSEKVLTLAADFLVHALGRENGRVGILMVLPESNHLTFAYPGHLAKGNIIPIDNNSFAGRALRQRQVIVENNMAREPHLDFYERIRDKEGKTSAIQKMITAPLMTPDGKTIGVIQVSRTGNSPAEAGADFTLKDGENLAKGCRVFAPYIARTWTREKG